MRKIIILLTLPLFTFTASHAVTLTELWITGSAVPNGAEQLTVTPDGTFRFSGSLNEGTLYIMTTETAGDGTYYLAPRYDDSYIVNNGLTYKLTEDATSDGWVVPFQEDRYRFYVDPSAQTVTGEIFVPWQEAYVGGGATEGGWGVYIMQEMTQDEDDIMVWSWTGELKERTEYEEPRNFKIMGNEAWNDKALHPFTTDEEPLTTTMVRTGGDDTKWTISEEGTYRITVNVFHETFSAELVDESEISGTTKISGVRSSACDIDVLKEGNAITVNSDSPFRASLYSSSGSLVSSKNGSAVTLQIPGHGLYLLRVEGQQGDAVHKIVN